MSSFCLDIGMSMEYEPRLTEPLKASYNVREGQPVKLSCRFDAHPKGDIQWLKEGVPIDFEALGISRDFKVSILQHLATARWSSSFLTNLGSQRSRLHCSVSQRSVSGRYRLLYSGNSQRNRRGTFLYSIDGGRVLLSNTVSR
jgi:hypothetical protein